MKSDKLFAWASLSRLPFHLLGLFPFALGSLLAYETGMPFSRGVFVLALAAIVLIMLATYYAGEYWDQKQDSISARVHLNRFAGGTRMILSGRIEQDAPFWASLACLALALLIGLVLQFDYRTGIWTFPLGLLGVVGGYFYSTPPFRWVSKGLGELWIGFCYSWLPITAGFYLQTGSFSQTASLMAIPIGLSIFNIILLNEFPNYSADKACGKKNLVVRFRREAASYLYVLASILSWGAVYLNFLLLGREEALYIYLPVFIVSLFLTALVLMSFWEDDEDLEKICGANVLVSLGTTAVFIFVIMF
ncbi:MAG: prenyltransferase [Candidatus Margulisbacteria bacterium]|nr:prenyltransferase [Candidatus Margulisiibacteriota bacterium]